MNKPVNTKSVKRSSARLAAVQALYEIEFADSPVDEVLIEFQKTRWETPHEEGDEDRTTSPLAKPDKALFSDIIRNVSSQKADLENILSEGLTVEWTIDRLEHIVRLILICGIYELKERLDIPPKVVITQYVDVAHAFFAGSEPGFINGVLDKIAHVLRQDELNKS